MFRLDYLSCFLTILATVLVGRKSWTGLLISIVNNLIVCVIGFRTSQFGFIPANLICICVYALNIRSWLKNTRPNRIRKHAGRAASVPNSSVLGFTGASGLITIGQELLKFNTVRRGYHELPIVQKRKGFDLAKKSADHSRHKVEIATAMPTDSHGSVGPERIATAPG